MKISIKLLLLSILALGGFGFIGISTPNIQAQDLSKCEGFGANFADCGIGDIKVAGTADSATTKEALVTTIKKAINRVLGILSLITLVLLLRGGFQMVTAAGDDAKYKAGFKILKQAAFGLAFIGLSWLIVSMIFWIINLITT